MPSSDSGGLSAATVDASRGSAFSQISSDVAFTTWAAGCVSG
ncbi:MAG: hypothetical protein PGN15_12890 [Aeromicrobium erythreum]